eukprot:1182920-Prorocentrum_minimum.AAC.4
MHMLRPHLLLHRLQERLLLRGVPRGGPRGRRIRTRRPGVRRFGRRKTPKPWRALGSAPRGARGGARGRALEGARTGRELLALRLLARYTPLIDAQLEEVRRIRHVHARRDAARRIRLVGAPACGASGSVRGGVRGALAAVGRGPLGDRLRRMIGKEGCLRRLIGQEGLLRLLAEALRVVLLGFLRRFRFLLQLVLDRQVGRHRLPQGARQDPAACLQPLRSPPVQNGNPKTLNPKTPQGGRQDPVRIRGGLEWGLEWGLEGGQEGF